MKDRIYTVNKKQEIKADRQTNIIFLNLNDMERDHLQIKTFSTKIKISMKIRKTTQELDMYIH